MENSLLYLRKVVAAAYFSYRIDDLILLTLSNLTSFPPSFFPTGFSNIVRKI